MNKSLEKVKEFQETFELPVGNINEVESLESRQLRISLIFEELLELAIASDCLGTMQRHCENVSSFDIERHDGNNVNKIEELDALCDLKYVLYGKIITAGYHRIFDYNFDLVHQNNMNKAHRSYGHCIDTVEELYVGHDGTELIDSGKYKISGALNNLLYNKAGKLIKPYDFKKVKLTLTTPE